MDNVSLITYNDILKKYNKKGAVKNTAPFYAFKKVFLKSPFEIHLKSQNYGDFSGRELKSDSVSRKNIKKALVQNSSGLFFIT